MRFLINIGNTHTQVAVLQQDDPVLLERYDTMQLLETGCIPLLDAHADATAYASSVVPKLRQALAKTYPDRIKFLTHEDFKQIDFSLVDTSTLGIDRICNAAAILAHVKNGPVAVFDCGTCLASEAIDAQSRFLGGAIAPGRQLLRYALHDHTAQLPCVPLTNNIPNPMGNNTANAILAGVDLGAIGTLKYLIQETRNALDVPDCPVFLTGGDAPYFLNALPEAQPAPELLTLKGIATIIR